MQLRSARLCLDCDEVHDAPQCPACASESFAFITRWVPVPDRPERPERPPGRVRSIEPASAETLGAYRQMLRPEDQSGGKWRTVRRGAMGLAIFGIAGWLWRQNTRQPGDAAQTTDETTQQRN
jgi:hypothetical protein